MKSKIFGWIATILILAAIYLGCAWAENEAPAINVLWAFLCGAGAVICSFGINPEDLE